MAQEAAKQAEQGVDPKEAYKDLFTDSSELSDTEKITNRADMRKEQADAILADENSSEKRAPGEAIKLPENDGLKRHTDLPAITPEQVQMNQELEVRESKENTDRIEAGEMEFIPDAAKGEKNERKERELQSEAKAGYDAMAAELRTLDSNLDAQKNLGITIESMENDDLAIDAIGEDPDLTAGFQTKQGDHRPAKDYFAAKSPEFKQAAYDIVKKYSDIYKDKKKKIEREKGAGSRE